VTAPLETRVAALEAEGAVRSAFARYCRAIDARDLVGVGSVFADDGVLENAAGRFEGRDRVLAHLEAIGTGGRWATHLVGAIEITTDDVAAPTAEAAFLFLSPSGSGLGVSAGRYDAQLAASDDGEMRFSRLRIDIGYRATLATEGEQT
jgi:uncharacterized protein (TIGR02246 family)